MSRDGTVIPFRQPEAIDDPLTEVAREGARRMLAQVLIVEADAFVAQWKDLKLPDGRDRVVRHGHGPKRAIQTGVGPIEIRRAKVRDRADVAAEEKIRFTSSILPKWARRTKSLDALLPPKRRLGNTSQSRRDGVNAPLAVLRPQSIASSAYWQASLQFRPACQGGRRRTCRSARPRCDCRFQRRSAVRSREGGCHYVVQCLQAHSGRSAHFRASLRPQLCP